MNYWIYHYIDRYIGIGIEFILLFFDKIKKFLINKKFENFDKVLVNKILVIKLTMIGDTILLYPAVKALKEKFRNAKIKFLCSRINYEIVKMWNLVDVVDEVIVFEFDKIFKNPLVILRQFFKLWREKFDLGVDFEQWFRITSIIAFITSKYKIGFRTPRQLRHYLFNKYIWHIKDKHEVECFCDIVRSLGAIVEDKNLFIIIDDTAKQKIKRTLYFKNIVEKKFIIIHPGCGIHGFYREWDVEKYAEIAEYIISKYKYSVVLTGSKDDIKKITSFEKINIPNEFFLNLIGKTTIQELIALVSMAKFVICGNTGVLHIAAALGIPTVAIHGPTNPKKWGPWGKGHIVVQSNLDCIPCSYLGFEYGCKKRKCLKAISIDDVKQMIDQLFAYN